jgi:hypothetical protein
MELRYTAGCRRLGCGGRAAPESADAANPQEEEREKLGPDIPGRLAVNIRIGKGESGEAGLKFAEEPVPLSGELGIELTTKEKVRGLLGRI